MIKVMHFFSLALTFPPLTNQGKRRAGDAQLAARAVGMAALIMAAWQTRHTHAIRPRKNTRNAHNDTLRTNDARAADVARASYPAGPARAEHYHSLCMTILEARPCREGRCHTSTTLSGSEATAAAEASSTR